MSDDPPSASVDRELTTQIVAAYVRRNQVASDQLASLIATVYRALGRLGKSPATTSEGNRPYRLVQRRVPEFFAKCARVRLC
jgi:predicted transcriptional regulator